MTVIDQRGPNIRQRALLALAARKVGIATSKLDLARALLAQGLHRQTRSALLAANEPLRHARKLIRTADAFSTASCCTGHSNHPLAQEFAA